MAGTLSTPRWLDSASRHPRLTRLGRISQCFKLLESKQVQAVANDDVILTGLLSRDPKNFEIVGDHLPDEPYGIGIKKDRPEFVEFVNNCLARSRTTRPG